MGLFDKLFGKKPADQNPQQNPAPQPQPAETAPAQPAPAAPPTQNLQHDTQVLPATHKNPSTDPNMIRVFDAYGRELFISRDDWRNNVLLANLKKAWDKPDDLYNMIARALNDGFRADIIDATQHLYEIDPIPVRRALIWGIVLREEGRLDEAENVFRTYLQTHGDDGVILTNLAKVESKRNHQPEAEEMLWRAIELDPNQENGLTWYIAIHRERAGEEAAISAMQKVAALPKSWRAQMWLARAALAARNLDQATALYHQALDRAGTPTPGDLLMQLSGDLGNHGHLPELVSMTAPRYDAKFHGIAVGNNLIKANIDLGQIDEARRLLDELYAQNRPDWKQTLTHWDTELAKARLSSPGAQPPELQFTMLTVEGPVWLKPDGPAADLFAAPASHTADGISVAFLGSCAEIATNSKRPEHQLADGPGRMSRSLPLYLAEQLALGSNARVQTLIPWVLGERPAFVLSGVPWTDDDAAVKARIDNPHDDDGKYKSDYVVAVNLKATGEPWSVELRLIRTIDAKLLGSVTATWHSDNPAASLPTLSLELLDLIAKEAEVTLHAQPAIYQAPLGPQFTWYLLRLEQLLAVRCASMENMPHGFLSGERAIIDGNLQLCLDNRNNTSLRILLAQSLATMKKVRPDILPEFREKIAMLQKEAPLEEPAQSVIQRMIDEVFA
jgi:tetratricopeptide (TPR) repeat protein